MKRLFRSITPKRRRRGDKNKPPKSRNEDPRDFISDDVIARILQLEELMDTEAWNMQMTQELVMLYSKVVEHYDGVRDPIRKYFVEKIQITLTKKALSHQREKREKKESPRKVDGGGGGLLSPNAKDGSPKTLDRIPSKSRHSNMRVKKMNLQKQREKRSRHWQFEMNVNKNRKNIEHKSIDKVLQNHEIVEGEIESLVEQSLKQQKEELMKKIKERRERSFSRSISAMGNGEKSGKSTKRSKKKLTGQPMFKSSPRGPIRNQFGTDNILAMINTPESAKTEAGGKTEEEKTE